MHETLAEVLKTLVRVAIPLASFATGLRAASADPLWLVRRPGLLARSLFAVLVVIPVGTVALLQSIAAPPLVKAGLTIAVVAVGIGPPAAFSRTKGRGKSDETVSYEIALNVLLLAFSIVYLPAVVALHGAIFHHDLRLSPAQVGKVVLGRALIPLFLGAVVGRIVPRAVSPVRKHGGLFVQVVLLVVVAVALFATRHGLMSLGGPVWLTCVAIVAAEIAIGHFAGGPRPDTRRVLASFSAMRFPALALLLAQIAPRGREFLPVILAYTLTSVVLVGIHGGLTSRRERHGPAGTRPVPRAPRGHRAPHPI